jgi:electron transport complex protein RnfG
MEKLQSTFGNMFLSLTVIGLCAGGLLATANRYTSATVARAKAASLSVALDQVCPDFDNDPVSESFLSGTAEGDSLRVYPAKQGGVPVGTAVESMSRNGFGGEMRVLVGFDTEGKVVDYFVLQHTETPGLGSKMQEWFRMQEGYRSIIGRQAGSLTVSNDGGDVDGITAATISSRAFLECINKGYGAIVF